MSGPVFEAIYRDKLWRVSISEFQGQRRLTIWSHYQDRETGEWKPCGGKREAPGFIVPAERQPELEAAIIAIGAQLRSATG
jgi:hypothetical protein